MSKVIVTPNPIKALEILKKAGIEAKIDNALDCGLEYEAEYRLDCFLDYDEDARKVYYSLSEEKQTQIIDGICSRYTESDSQIFDYDYMDDIVTEEFNKVTENKEE